MRDAKILLQDLVNASASGKWLAVLLRESDVDKELYRDAEHELLLLLMQKKQDFAKFHMIMVVGGLFTPFRAAKWKWVRTKKLRTNRE
ncbi:MAG: hypothetical protein WA160_04290 [Pseudobdellovibrio sp.]